VPVIGDELAYTVDPEHMTRNAGEGPQPRTLRWRKDEQQR
jgi:hypothetical protein